VKISAADSIIPNKVNKNLETVPAQRVAKMPYSLYTKLNDFDKQKQTFVKIIVNSHNKTNDYIIQCSHRIAKCKKKKSSLDWRKFSVSCCY
jgi:3-methyladenine DNA glycosylase AlkC